MGQAETYAGILSHWNGTDFRMYRHLAGFVSLIFLSTYAAAQFVARQQGTACAVRAGKNSSEP